MYQLKIKQLLAKQGKTQPTLIQRQTYEAIKSGASVVALAKTGTGKTLAYALPALENTVVGAANSLVILAPTPELAIQIRNVLNPFLSLLGLKGASLVGAGNRKRQVDRLKKKRPEVIVATPGRFFDFFSAGRIKTAQIKTLVVDEADDILEFTKEELLSSLGQNLGPDSQILLFGATSSPITENAETVFRRHFLLIDVRKEQKARRHHYFLQVDNAHKIEFLQRLTRLPHFKGLLFFDSNAALRRFAGIFAHTKNKFAVLSNDLGKRERAQALRNFNKGRFKLLLATDLAARGLDIPDLTYVINFELPKEKNTYLHRAGRTARMEASGIVVTLGDDHDFRDLRHLLGQKEKLTRVYFAGDHLTAKKPHAQKRLKEFPKNKKKKKHQKRRNKNKGYHPHYLKVKK